MEPLSKILEVIAVETLMEITAKAMVEGVAAVDMARLHLTKQAIPPLQETQQLQR